MKHQKERNLNQYINSKLQRSSYWKKKGYGEEIERMKSNIRAMLAKRVKEKNKR